MNDKEWERRRYEKVKPAYDALMKVYPLGLDDLQGEIWLPVPDYDGYQISNFGRVKSLQERWRKPRILEPVLTKRGYLRAQLCIEEKAKSFAVHRLVAQLFIPNPEGKSEINHRDGNKLNNHVSNLEWATRSENMCHAVDTGLKVAPQGEDSPNAKLTTEQVLYIRANPLNLKCYELAEMFGVCVTKISAVQLGKTYKNVGGAIRQSKRPRLSKAI